MAKALPPLNAIRAFEAASRHLNLSRAAEELGVTQGAISKQVIALEDFIGVQLFERDGSGIQLTHEGANLKEAIRPAFALLGDAFVRYARRSPRSNVVRVSTIPSFAGSFLASRLEAFRTDHPGMDLEFQTSSRLVDLLREEIDFTVRYGPGGWEGVVTTQLVDGVFVPVCAPSLLKAASGDLDKLLATTRRLRNSSFNEWRGWCDLAGVPYEKLQPADHMEDFLVCLGAACEGVGLALLPEIVVRDKVREGRLAVFSNVWMPTDYTYHICHTQAAVRRAPVRDAIAWLTRTAQDTLPRPA